MSDGHLNSLTLLCMVEKFSWDRRSCDIQTFKNFFDIPRKRQCMGSMTQDDMAL